MNDLKDYCFLYTEQGEGTIKYQGQEYTLADGGALLINGLYLEHIHSKERKDWNFYFILLSGKNISPYYDLLTNDGVCLLPFSKYSNIPTILKKLEHYASPTTIKDAAILSKYITDILTELFIETNNVKNTIDVIPNYILKIKELFDTKYAQPHTLDSIAKQFHRSKYKLSRDFTKYMNVSPIEYLICRRIHIAKELLCETDDLIHDIGSAIGMENTNHFISTFKKKTGVTPLSYRNKHQINSLCD